jgi:hypothetical protein
MLKGYQAPVFFFYFLVLGLRGELDASFALNSCQHPQLDREGRK